MQNKRNAGFTLIELMIVVAIIAIIAAIAIPKLMSARISANENAAIATLRSIAAAQHQLESSVAIDTDADGGGEFGFFGELAGADAVRVYDPTTGNPAIGTADDVLDPPILPTHFGAVLADSDTEGVVERQGYYFKMWLPDATVVATDTIPAVAELGTGGTNSAAYPDPANAEILWACYAWPVDAEKTGNRAFFVNQEGDLLQYDNMDQAYEGLTSAPDFDAAFDDTSGGSDMSNDLGITALGFTANDASIWKIVGN